MTQEFLLHRPDWQQSSYLRCAQHRDDLQQLQCVNWARMSSMALTGSTSNKWNPPSGDLIDFLSTKVSVWSEMTRRRKNPWSWSGWYMNVHFITPTADAHTHTNARHEFIGLAYASLPPPPPQRPPRHCLPTANSVCFISFVRRWSIHFIPVASRQWILFVILQAIVYELRILVVACVQTEYHFISNCNNWRVIRSKRKSTCYTAVEP